MVGAFPITLKTVAEQAILKEKTCTKKLNCIDSIIMAGIRI